MQRVDGWTWIVECHQLMRTANTVNILLTLWTKHRQAQDDLCALSRYPLRFEFHEQGE